MDILLLAIVPVVGIAVMLVTAVLSLPPGRRAVVWGSAIGTRSGNFRREMMSFDDGGVVQMVPSRDGSRSEAA